MSYFRKRNLRTRESWGSEYFGNRLLGAVRGRGSEKRGGWKAFNNSKRAKGGAMGKEIFKNSVDRRGNEKKNDRGKGELGAKERA